jgi:hypothetical protein
MSATGEEVCGYFAATDALLTLSLNDSAFRLRPLKQSLAHSRSMNEATARRVLFLVDRLELEDQAV